LHNTKKSYWL